LHVQGQPNPNLPKIADAYGLIGRRTCAGQGGQQQRSENRDDRNNHEQFDQRERRSANGREGLQRKATPPPTCPLA
jgi:hypothetical protein